MPNTYCPGRFTKKIPQLSAHAVPSANFHGYQAAKSILTPRLRISGTTMKKAMLKSPMRTSHSDSRSANQSQNFLSFDGQTLFARCRWMCATNTLWGCPYEPDVLICLDSSMQEPGVCDFLPVFTMAKPVPVHELYAFA